MPDFRCLIGWHSPSLLGASPMQGGGTTYRQGCPRCHRTRIVVKSPYGRTVEVTRWT